MRYVLALADVMLIRYLLASVLALAVDVGSFLILLQAGIGAAPASALGYSIGIVAHWLLSSRTVFVSGVVTQGPGRTRQKVLFVMSALLGLALTTGIVGLVSSGGADPRLAKLIAIAVSFAATWLLRERVVFRAGAAA